MGLAKQIQTVAMVGARGQMGTLFTDRCNAAGIEVRPLDRPLSADDYARALDGADVFFVSVPASAMGTVLEMAKPFMSPDLILSDNVSVKVQPMKQMLEIHDGPVVGTHPLFGPVPDEASAVAVTPGPREPDQAAAAVIEEWIERMGFKHFRTTPEEHDRCVAKIQGLNFVTSVAYFAALSHDDEITHFLTPSFRRRLDAAKKLITEDAELFTGLFEANPFGQDAVREFRNYLHIAAGGDVDILVDRANWWWRRED